MKEAGSRITREPAFLIAVSMGDSVRVVLLTADPLRGFIDFAREDIAAHA